MMQRTHRLREDRAWLPRSVRAPGSAVSGAIWAAAGAAIVGTAALGGPAAFAMWKGLVIGGAAAAAAGDRAGNAVLHRPAEAHDARRATARGAVGARRGRAGRRARQGRVRVAADRCARRCRRRVSADDLRAERQVGSRGGDRLHADRRQGRAHHHPEPPARAGWCRHASPSRIPARGSRRTRRRAWSRRSPVRRPTIEAYEQVLAIGTEVQVVGYKTASADVSGEVDRLPHAAAARHAALRRGSPARDHRDVGPRVTGWTPRRRLGPRIESHLVVAPCRHVRGRPRIS